jgi:hypothetical protein
MVTNALSTSTTAIDVGWWQATLDAWTTTPESIKGVLIGAVLTGVVSTIVTILANRHARKTQAKQFEFEERERARERTLQLRRDVYMPAVDALVGMFTMLGQMVNLKATDQSIAAATQSFGTSISRVQMVASEQTIKVVSALQRAMLAEMAAIHVDVYPMQLRKSDIDIAESARSAYAQSRDQIVELMRIYRTECADDPPRWEELRRQFDFAVQEHDLHLKRWAQLSADQLENQQTALTGYAGRMEMLMGLLNSALVSVRKELEFEGAEAALAEELRVTADSAKVSLEKIASVIGPTIEKIRNDQVAEI